VIIAVDIASWQVITDVLNKSLVQNLIITQTHSLFRVTTVCVLLSLCLLVFNQLAIFVDDDDLAMSFRTLVVSYFSAIVKLIYRPDKYKVSFRISRI